MKSNHPSDARFQHYDIVRKDHDHYAVWLESAPDLISAESRIEELRSVWPGGEFQVVDQQSHQVVARVDTSPSAAESDEISATIKPQQTSA